MEETNEELFEMGTPEAKAEAYDRSYMIYPPDNYEDYEEYEDDRLL